MLQMLDNLICSIITVSAVEASAGMSCCTAQIQIPDWSRILRTVDGRSHKEELVQHHFSLVQVSLRQSILALQVFGGQHFLVFNEVTKTGSIFL